MASLIPVQRLNRIVAGQAKSATAAEALSIGVRAEAALAGHRHDGDHKVTVTEGRRSDAFVNLEGPAPMSVEFGHWTGYKARAYVPGLRILRDAAGL